MEEGSRTHPRALWIGTGEAGLEEQVQILGTENRGAWIAGPKGTRYKKAKNAKLSMLSMYINLMPKTRDRKTKEHGNMER
jgi:hypothetical protein